VRGRLAVLDSVGRADVVYCARVSVGIVAALVRGETGLRAAVHE
jgi:hypothetical protein